MTTDLCPTDQSLDAFRLGDLSVAEAERVSRHLDGCPACEARANALDAADDPVAAAIQNSTIKFGSPQGGFAVPAAGGVPEFVGGYRVLEVLGRGGMGVVYKAQQVGLNRPVAVKMIAAGRYAGPEAQIRFRIEGEVLARLRHPNIVQVFETGRHDGWPFLVLEWVEGGNLEKRLSGPPVPPAEAAALVEAVARAVHYAHLNGVVHRDLKPANVLLAADGTPKVTDFGLAKPAGDAETLTAPGVVMGTPAYMAPEQARGDGKLVGPAADTHALGAILFALLTGRPPFLAADAEGIVWQVLTQPAPPASRFRPGLPRDLVTICGHCLEKDPGKRYVSAEHLAADLGRFREGRPILARSTPLWERAWLAARRKPQTAALIAAGGLALAAGVGSAGWQWREAVTARGVAEAETRLAGQRAARLSVEKGLALCETWEVAHGLLWLARGLREAEQAGDPDLAAAARANIAAWADRVPRPAGRPFTRERSVLAPDAEGGAAVVFSPDGRIALACGWDYCLDLWRLSDRAQLNPSRQLINPLGLLSGSAGARAAAVRPGAAPDLGGRFTLALAQADGYATLWTVTPGRPPERGRVFPHPTKSVWGVAFSPDGDYMLTACDDGRGRVWHVGSGRLAAELDHATGEPGSESKAAMFAVAFPAPRLALTGTRGRGTRLWRLPELPRDGAGPAVRLTSGDATSSYPLTTHGGNVFTLAAAPLGSEGLRVVIGGEGTAEVWDFADLARETSRPKPAPGDTPARRWLPRVVFAGPLSGHASRLGAADIAEDSPAALTADHNGYVRLWDTDTLQPLGQPIRHPARVMGARFSPNGRQVLVSGEDQQVVVWDVPVSNRVGQPLQLDQPILDVRPDGPGGAVMAATMNGVWEWDGKTDAKVVWSRNRSDRGYAVRFAAFAPGGRNVFLGSIAKGAHRVWGEPRFGQSGETFPANFYVTAAAFTPDGAGLVTTHSGIDGTPDFRRWDLAGAAPAAVPGWGEPAIRKPLCLAFTPDGRRLLVGCQGEAVLLDAATGRATGEKLATASAVTAVAFRADGVAAVGGQDGSIRLWDPARQAARGPAMQADGGIASLAFGRDGNLLLAGSIDGTARFWDLATGLPVGPPLRHRRSVTRVTFAPDGKTALTAGAEGMVIRWRVPDAPNPGTDYAAAVRDRIGMELGPDGLPKSTGAD